MELKQIGKGELGNTSIKIYKDNDLTIYHNYGCYVCKWRGLSLTITKPNAIGRYIDKLITKNSFQLLSDYIRNIMIKRMTIKHLEYLVSESSQNSFKDGQTVLRTALKDLLQIKY